MAGTATKAPAKKGAKKGAVATPLQEQIDALLTQFPSTYDNWANSFEGASVVKSEAVEKKDKSSSYARTTLQDESGNEFFAGSNAIAKAAKDLGIPVDKCSFTRSFAKEGDLSTATIVAELAA